MSSILLLFYFFLSWEINFLYSEVHASVEFNKLFHIGNFPNCTNDDECQSFIEGSKCENKNCICNSNTILSSDATKCLPLVKNYGAPCEDNIQCSNTLSVGGICFNNKCICKPGFHYLKGTCWKSIDLRGKCFRNEQCFSTYEFVGLECKTVCQCRNNYYKRLESGCRRKIKPGNACRLDEDCEVGSCEERVCSSSNVTEPMASSFSAVKVQEAEKAVNCSKGRFELGNKLVISSNTVIKLELGMDCESDLECNHISNALCLDKKFCACKPAAYVASEDNQKCLPVSQAKVDDIYMTTCKTNAQCLVFGRNSICENKRCACKNGTYFEKKNQFCWTIQSLGERCTINEDCYPSLTYAECKETKANSERQCVCKAGYHQKEEKCIPNALKVGDFCLDDDDCFFPNSACNESHVCTCKEYYYLENGKCIPGVNTLCTSNENCTHLMNSECRAGNLEYLQCLCRKNFTSSEKFNYCLPESKFKEKCMESFQCKFSKQSHGVCKEGVCECSETEHFSDGECYKSKRIGDTCIRQNECFPGNDSNSVLCLRGFCICNFDYELDGNGICLKTNSATTIKFYSVSLIPLVFFLMLKE